MQIQLEILGLDQGFGEIGRVFEDHDVGQNIAVADEVFGHGGLVAHHHAVAAHPAGFDVRRLDGENVAVPFTGGESHPGVGSVGGRMRRGRPSRWFETATRC